jgi:hypothetical protein
VFQIQGQSKEDATFQGQHDVSCSSYGEGGFHGPVVRWTTCRVGGITTHHSQNWPSLRKEMLESCNKKTNKWGVTGFIEITGICVVFLLSSVQATTEEQFLSGLLLAAHDYGPRNTIYPTFTWIQSSALRNNNRGWTPLPPKKCVYWRLKSVSRTGCNSVTWWKVCHYYCRPRHSSGG